jgi:hypothetical protein
MKDNLGLLKYARNTKSHSDFIGRFEESIEKQMRENQTQKILLHQLTFDNTNEDCQSLI